MFRGAHAGENGRAIPETSQGKCDREPARGEYSRVASSLEYGAGHRPADFGNHRMTVKTNWPRVAVVGAGAVGGYFGGMLARAGAPVMMIGRAAFVEAVKKNGLFLDAVQFKESVRVEASTELKDVRGAEVVLFCVKTTDNAATAKELASVLARSEEHTSELQ